MKKSKDNEVKNFRKPTDDPLFIIGIQIYSYNGITRLVKFPSPLTTTYPRLTSILEALRMTQKLVSKHSFSLALPQM